MNPLDFEVFCLYINQSINFLITITRLVSVWGVGVRECEAQGLHWQDMDY